ncbi:MAG: DinB family protein [Chloroflexi bacterium]|nr:DinB family protein [Chloroflexota bacterium]
MALNSALAKNLVFWHWYPQLLVKDLSPEQMRWQPEGHDSSIVFTVWHTYRAADELCHGLVMGRPSVFASQGWASRLPVAETGQSPFGNGLSREQIGRINLDTGELCAYATAVGESIVGYLASLTDAEAAEEVSLPFFTGVYPEVDRLSKLETITFFAIGHTAEHLGELQFIRGLMGLKGAPL